ncbi:HD-GYP domain-containing protein [Rheinheimera salexigens]|uniref:Phosphohydrolase n=1 Tax=Rheinheimera salexigens TaxID=1628148 RepID=A0A1E7Q9I6_9GAMM|nr:HD-GYP domain-containing protein [Rheinheimera salexigens]OEY70806.1 phosphohydrolase [Rheinheimera salexigens]
MAFKQVPISELSPGSFVVQVLQQSGDIAVKHAGWVRTASAVALLQKKGVQVVLIDPSKQLAAAISPITDNTEPAIAEAPADPILFADEMPRAERLIQQSQQVQSHVLDAAKHGKMIDLSLVHEVSAGISDSIARNQDVLLFLIRMAEQSDALLQHSINCAIYIAAFARHLNLPIDKVQALITAALLHDIGKASYAEPLQQADHLTISKTLKLLQKHPHLAGVVSLWIGQHCAHLDGSGHPKMSSLHIDHGSRMLAIVNNYEKLTSPQQGKFGPLTASRQLLQQSPQQLDSTLLQQFIKCIGIYPPGSVVKLSSGKLALVLENNVKKPLLPKVKLFYHSVHQHHIPVKVVDLAKQQDETIEACIDLKHYNLDIKNYL